jgi:hypothetical protein
MVEFMGCGPKKETKIIREAGKSMESLCLENNSVTYQNEEKEAEPSPIKLCLAGTTQNEVRVHIF